MFLWWISIISWFANHSGHSPTTQANVSNNNSLLFACDVFPCAVYFTAIFLTAMVVLLIWSFRSVLFHVLSTANPILRDLAHNLLSTLVSDDLMFFDVHFSSERTVFLKESPYSCSGSTSEAIFESINTEFKKHGISWNNVRGLLRVDKTNANNGNGNSLKTRVLRKNGEVVIAGCLCHILHTFKFRQTNFDKQKNR